MDCAFTTLSFTFLETTAFLAHRHTKAVTLREGGEHCSAGVNGRLRHKDKNAYQAWRLYSTLPATGPAWKESTYLSMQSRRIIKLQPFRGREEEKNTHKCAGVYFSWTLKIIFLSCSDITHRSTWHRIWEKSWVDGNDLWGEGEEEGSSHIILCVPFSPCPFSEPEHTNERVGGKKIEHLGLA